MPVRDRFDPGIFDGNPFEGLDPDEVYRKLRWGNEPDESWSIQAPEHMATLGTVAMLDFGESYEEFDESEAPFLAVGTDSNLLYIVPRDDEGNPFEEIPSGPYEEIGTLERIDYYSEKGGDPYYFYHEHEKPYPWVGEHKQTGIRIVVPADNRGRRSYAVDEPGVIG